MKINGRDIEILFPISTFSFSLTLAWDSVSVYQISSKLDHLQPSYDVILIFKMADISHVGFAVGNGRPPMKCS